MNTLLEAKQLGFRCRRSNSWLFKDVHLEIKSADIAVIYGNAGSGKTVLSDMICGLRKPSQGFVAKKVPVAVSTQDFSLYKDLTVQENLDFFSAIYEYPSANLSEIIALTGLNGWENIRANRLPAGLRKMLQIACTIIQKTPVVIFDEPTCGLDEPLMAKFQKLILFMVEEQRGIIIMSCQKMGKITPTQEWILTDKGLTASNSTASNQKTGTCFQSGEVG